MTLQTELFREVTNHLMQQGKPAYLSMENEETGEPQEGEECAYRGHGGKTCAVGCLIKDEFYAESLEHGILEPDNDELVEALSKSLDMPTSQIKGHIPMLRNLQQVHDRIPPKDWDSAFTMLGKMYGISGVSYA